MMKPTPPNPESAACPRTSRSLLLLLPQFPFDPANGAARSLRTICELLAGHGYRVRAIATTEHEAAGHVDPVAALTDLGISPAWERTSSKAVIARFRLRGVDYSILDTEDSRSGGASLNELLRAELSIGSFDVALTFGGSSDDQWRRELLRSRGTAVVFGLRNHGYMDPRAFRSVDAVVTPSAFLSRRYRERLGLRSVPLPTPISIEDTVASERRPVFTTFINPSVEKGVGVVSAIVERLRRSRPDIPFLIVESRGLADHFIWSGELAGWSHRELRQVMIAPPVLAPARIFEVTRMLLVPSLWEEPSGRVAAEALVNGVPTLVSDRGGLPETIAAGGEVLPLPADASHDRLRACSPESGEIRAWCDAIVRMADDDAHYASLSRRAAESGATYLPDRVGPLYRRFFDEVRFGADLWEA